MSQRHSNLKNLITSHRTLPILSDGQKKSAVITMGMQTPNGIAKSIFQGNKKVNKKQKETKKASIQ